MDENGKTLAQVLKGT